MAQLLETTDIESWDGARIREQAAILYHMRNELAKEDYIAMAQPYISEINKRGAAVAKKYGKRFKPFDYTWLNNAAT